MGTVGDCCCCNISDQEELASIVPDWEIPGFTALTGWQLLPVESNNPCCIGRTYRAPNDAPFTETFSGTLARMYVKETGRAEVRAMESHPNWLLANCGITGLPSQVQCDVDVGLAYSIDFENIEETLRRARLQYRLWEIEVRIGQHVTNCGENAGKRIYTITIVFKWQARLAYQNRFYERRIRDITVVHPCMTQTVADSDVETTIDWVFLTDPNVFNGEVLGRWAAQYLTLPDELTVDTHASPIDPEYFQECIEPVAGCYLERVPKTPDCFEVSATLEDTTPLMEFDDRESCVTRSFGSSSIECCESWQTLVRQSGYTGRFGVAPVYPNSTGTGFQGLSSPVSRGVDCCDPCVPSGEVVGTEVCVIFGKHNIVDYAIEAEHFNTPASPPTLLCLPESTLLFDATP